MPTAIPTIQNARPRALAALLLLLATAACDEQARGQENAVEGGGTGAGAGAGTGAGAGAGAGTGAGAGAGTGAGAGASANAGAGAGAGGSTPIPTAGSSGTAGSAEPDAGSSGGVPDAGPSADAGTPPALPETGTFPAVTDLQAKGPFTARQIADTGPMNRYTVFLPSELGKDGRKHPLVGWMSGGSTAPSWYTLLPHLATHGFVIVASNTVPAIGTEIELGKEIIAGIDWALAENARAGSELNAKLDASKIASMGYSMGGLATTTIADDPRLTTTVHISGGNMVIERIQKLHAPAAFICGENDIAQANCATDFEAADTPVFYGTFMGGDHLGILFAPYDARIRGAVTGWLRWQLMSDLTQKPLFVGSDCALCKDANWTVKQKLLM